MDKVAYKGWTLLLDKEKDRWVIALSAPSPAHRASVIHAGTLAAAVNRAFAVIDAEENGRRCPAQA